MAAGVTLVILNWNGRKHLETFMPSVVASGYPDLTILLADNGSTDDSLDFLRKEFPEVKILPFDRNHGFTVGNNLALAHVTTPYYVLLNNDVEVEPGWIGPLVEVMERDPLVAVVQPKLMAYRQKDHFEYAGAAGGYVDVFGYPFARGRMFEQVEKDEGQFEEDAEILWASGACMLVRKSVSDRLGLFEPSFFAHMEEIDFCWRAKNFGYKVMYTPKSKVYHLGGGTLAKSNPRKTFLNAHNSLVTLVKNFAGPSVYFRLYARLILDGVWAAKAMVGGDFRTIGAIFKAHWTFFFRLGFWFGQRRKLVRESGGYATLKAGYYPKSIVFQHFINGVRRFKDLPGIR